MADPLTGKDVVPKSNISINIGTLLKSLPTNPGKSYTVCIFRVSKKHREINEEAYTPRLVSIGPFHHAIPELQAMEAYKVSCLRDFLERNQVNIDELIKFATENELYVRGCYEGTITLKSDEFVQLILLDGIFVVELLLKSQVVEIRDKNDALYENRWMKKDILHDMLLLENQLPFTFLQELFDFVKFDTGHEVRLYDLIRKYFKDVGNMDQLMNCNEQTMSDSMPRHLIEFLVYMHWPKKPNNDSSKPVRTRKIEYSRTAVELQEAGVTFKRGTTKFLSEVSFNKDKGELELPHLKVNEYSETFFRNAIAFEQCGYNDNNITSYVILMDSLINVGKDVDLLVKYKIIDDLGGESEKVADMFNNLYKEVIENEKDFCFTGICDDLNTYSKDIGHKWKATRYKWGRMLMRDYFGNPWTIISVVTASIVVVLTFTQTVCAFGVC